MRLEYDEELRELEREHEKRFGVEFYAGVPGLETRKKMVREALNAGEPHGVDKVPGYDPDAWY